MGTGLAVSAQLLYPGGTAIDQTGDLFIADTGSNCIRKVTRDGLITTIAGLCGGGYSGFDGDGGPATAAYLFSPSSVVLDTAGNLFKVSQARKTIGDDKTAITMTSSGGRARNPHQI